MRSIMFLMAGVALLSAADDPWTKVKNIKSGTEVRIVRDGVRQPIIAKFDEAREESLLVVLKNEQVAIPREEIERLDARPAGGRTKLESQTKTIEPDASRPPAGPPGAGARGGTSSSSNLAIGKPDFETVYRRPPQKKK
jgi:hypothetical protein